MAEIIVRLTAAGDIRLDDDKGQPIGAVDPLTAQEAAMLGRDLLGAGQLLALAGKPLSDKVVGHFPLAPTKWDIRSPGERGSPELILTILPGIDLTLVITEDFAKILKRAQDEELSGRSGFSGTRH